MNARSDRHLCGNEGGKDAAGALDWLTLGIRIQRAAMAAAAMESVDQCSARDGRDAAQPVETGQ